MNKNRLEAFSDGVIAIILTIMVLELRAPHGTDADAILPVLGTLLRYLLSFIYVGIYWVNHHALFEHVERVDGAVLWANLHLLFWMSLIPFVTAWAGEHPAAPLPLALYGAVLLLCSIAFLLLAAVLRAGSRKAGRASSADWKNGKNLLSIGLYGLAIVLAWVYPPASPALHVLIALMWLRPSVKAAARVP